MLITPSRDLQSDSEREGMDRNQIHFRAEFTIEEGKIGEYKKLVQEMSKMVEANEPDTVSYRFYL
ncbi:MAG TPA: hypothetical protein VER14_01065, partial [Phototrophicaceae bacterium]|nr:hypothetical protein [Phototrophicaceae bacterium]